MTAIERTAYPTFDARLLHQQELDDYYTPTKDELCFIQNKLRYPKGTCTNYTQYQFNAITLLKCLSRLGYFPSLRTVPKIISDHIRHHLKIAQPMSLGYKHSQVLYRHQEIIRKYWSRKNIQANNGSINRPLLLLPQSKN